MNAVEHPSNRAGGECRLPKGGHRWRLDAVCDAGCLPLHPYIITQLQKHHLVLTCVYQQEPHNGACVIVHPIGVGVPWFYGPCPQHGVVGR